MFILSVFQECDSVNGVTCVNLNFLDQNGVEESVCLQCPDGTAGDGRECRGTQHSLVFPSIPHLHPSPLSLPLSFHPTLSLPSIPPLILPSHPFPPLHPSPYPSIPPFPSPPSLPLSFHPTLPLPSIPATLPNLPLSLSLLLFLHFSLNALMYLLPSSLSPSPSLTSISSLSVSPFITHTCLHP